LQLVRLTVVGAGGTGKTSLISAFVNNACPTVHAETSEPALYYRTLQVLPGKSDVGSQTAASLSSKVTLNALVEIEDTPPSDRGMQGKTSQSAGGVSSELLGELSRPTSLGTRPLSGPRDGEKYINCKRKADVRWSEAPFQGINAPKPKQHEPAGAGRMGFMVVFDASDVSGESLIQAKDLIEGIMHQEISHSVRPIVYVVANKADKLALSDTTPAVCHIARDYASERKLRYEEVSAMDLKKVRGVFRNLVSDIRDKQTLWKPPDDAIVGGMSSDHRKSAKDAKKGVVTNSSVSEAMSNNCRMQ